MRRKSLRRNMELTKIRKKVDLLLNDLRSTKKQFKEEKMELKKAKRKLRHTEKAQVIAQQVAQIVQQQAHKRIEGVVNKCLGAVFDNTYGFKILFKRKRGKTEAVLVLLKDGHEIEDVLYTDSGGVVETAAFALRLANIILNKPTLRRILIMDEPFRNLDMQSREKVRILLEELSKDFEVQFIIVTHELAFQIGKVIEL